MMDNDERQPPEPPPILLEKHDVAAIVALLIRTVRLDDELKRDNELVSEAGARITSNTVARSKTVAAFGVFGFDQGDGLWGRVLQSIGADEYGKAVAIAKGREVPELLERMETDKLRSSNESHSASRDHHMDSSSINHAPKIKDAILEYLRSVGDVGTNAREVLQHLANVHNLSVHEKTPGMTLYRLLKDGLARREGRTWFATVASEINENEASNGKPKDASETAVTAQ